MTDKQMAIDSLKRLPANADLREIQDRINFLVSLRQAEQSILSGRGIPQEEAKEVLAERIARWNSKSSGRPKRSTISKR